MSSCTASGAALLKLPIAKRKLIIQKYGTPRLTPLMHTTPLRDILHDISRDALDAPTLGKITEKYADTQVSGSFAYVALSSSLPPHPYLFQFWVVDSACSINLTAFRDHVVSFEPPSGSSRVGGVSVNVISSGHVRLAIPLVSLSHNTPHYPRSVYT
jgi:hypothetical protein